MNSDSSRNLIVNIIGKLRIPVSFYKRIAGLLCILLMSFLSHAGMFGASAAVLADIPETSDSIFSRTIYFPKASSYIKSGLFHNRRDLREMREFLDSLSVDRIVSIAIHGSSSPEGDSGFNEWLAARRAKALGRLLFGESSQDSLAIDFTSGVAKEQIASCWDFCRSARIDVRYLLPQEAFSDKSLVGGAKEQPADAPVVVADRQVSADRAAGMAESLVLSGDGVSGSALSSGSSYEDGCDGKGFPKMFLSTNVLYDAALVPNVGVGIYLGKRMTLYADWMHAWWSRKARHRYWRVYGGDIELRARLGRSPRSSVSPFSGHHLGVYASMATYDFQFGNRTGVMGNKYNYAAGLSYGYSLPVSRRLSFDFAVGVGYAWGKYKKHHPVDDHDVWLSTHKLKRFGPTRLEIGLQWLLGKGNHNARKGGRK